MAITKVIEVPYMPELEDAKGHDEIINILDEANRA